MASRRGNRRLRLAVISVAGLAAAVLGLHMVGGWYFASVLDDRALSAESRRQSIVPDYTLKVVAVDRDRVTLRGAGEERLARDGTFGLAWEGGWGVVGKVLGTGADGSVVREFEYKDGSGLTGGMLAAIDARVYQGDPLTGRGIAFESVDYEGKLGRYAAWFVPGTGPTWFIFVHGNSMTRLDSLRVLPALVEAGMPVFVPTYRGDEGAPEDPGGRLTYGKHEWRDLEAARGTHSTMALSHWSCRV
jgi:hypothetical protein